MAMIPMLLGIGTLCYCIFWLRYRASGLRLRAAPDWRPVALLILAAVVFAACKLIVA